MGRRPLCLFVLLIIGALLALNLIGADFVPVTADLKEALMRYAEPREAVLYGVADASAAYDDYTVCLLSDVSASPASAADGDGEGARPLSVGKVRLYLPPETIYPAGSVLRAEGMLSVIPGAENPGEFDRASYYRVQGIYLEMRQSTVREAGREARPVKGSLLGMKRAVSERIGEMYPSDAAGIMGAVLIGEKKDLPEDIRSLWRAGGILHMLAISGLHLSLIGMGIYRALRKMRLPAAAAATAAVSVILLYTLLIGAPVSAVRASVMLALLLAAPLIGRTYDPLTALAAAAVLILMENPAYLFYSGFQMSAGAVLTIILLGRRGTLMRALFLYLWMLPLTAYYYYEIPLMGVLVNLLAVPLLPLLLLFGIAGLFGEAGSVLALPGTALVRLMNEGLRSVRQLPFSVLVTGRPSLIRFAAYAAALLLFTCAYMQLRLYKRRFLLLFLLPLLIGILAFSPPALRRGRLKLTFLSVGQGDGILLELPEGKNILVDGGSSSKFEVGRRTLLPYLKYEGIETIDYMVATHLDEDHVSGLKELLQMAAGGTERLRIRAVVLPDLNMRDASFLAFEALARDAGARVLYAKRGDKLTFDQTRIEVLGPDKAAETVPPDGNAQCVVLGVHLGVFDALLTGDVEGDGESSLVRYLSGSKAYEVLKVAHHGSRNSTTEAFLDAVRPQIGVISVGRGNFYGHPHAALMQRLEEAGTRIYRTDEEGAVTVMTDGGDFAVSTFRAG